MKGKRAGSLGSRNSLTESMNQKYRVWLKPSMYRGFFPDSSDGKESAGSSGDPSSIPGSGRSAGEGIRYQLQCSWASLVAQLVKHPSAMQETWVRSLGWKNPLKQGKATHSSILAWRIPWTVHGVAKSRTQLRDFHFDFIQHVFIK